MLKRVKTRVEVCPYILIVLKSTAVSHTVLSPHRTQTCTYPAKALHVASLACQTLISLNNGTMEQLLVFAQQSKTVTLSGAWQGAEEMGQMELLLNVYASQKVIITCWSA